MKKLLQPNLFDMKNPPVKASVENSTVARKEAPARPPPLPPPVPPKQTEPCCAWCHDHPHQRGRAGLCACNTQTEERETSPNADPSSLTRAHPYKGKSVKDGDKMSPDKWRGKP